MLPKNSGIALIGKNQTPIFTFILKLKATKIYVFRNFELTYEWTFKIDDFLQCFVWNTGKLDLFEFVSLFCKVPDSKPLTFISVSLRVCDHILLLVVPAIEMFCFLL
jgi:hypothetical protein